MDPSRRAFFRARRPAPAGPRRPPWAIGEADFLNACTRCGDCLSACPTHLLVAGDGGFPEADFFPGHAPEGCTFCGQCAEACTPRALDRTLVAPAWHNVAVIGEDCLPRQGVTCRTCAERCEDGAIRFTLQRGGMAVPQLDSAACTGCAACLADCPVHALSIVSKGAAS